jgi:DNA invertase Pin-like site-specific DNA recombinase
VKTILAKGDTIKFHQENMVFTPDTENPTQTLYLNILGSIAQFERSLIRERQREGIAVAILKNAYKNVGRKPKLSPEQIADIKSKKELGIPVSRLARDYKVSRQTIYESIKSN